jgi:hypothetical protein
LLRERPTASTRATKGRAAICSAWARVVYTLMALSQRLVTCRRAPVASTAAT